MPMGVGRIPPLTGLQIVGSPRFVTDSSPIHHLVLPCWRGIEAIHENRPAEEIMARYLPPAGIDGFSRSDVVEDLRQGWHDTVEGVLGQIRDPRATTWRARSFTIS
jgi:hypothetical protein